jgi:hypothetical protein
MRGERALSMGEKGESARCRNGDLSYLYKRNLTIRGYGLAENLFTFLGNVD